jgi:hypothetical protein
VTQPVVAPVAPGPSQMIHATDGVHRQRRFPVGAALPTGWVKGKLRKRAKRSNKKMVRVGSRGR